jgi:hypothetical protein
MIYFQYEKLGESPYPNMAKIVFVLFQILIPILLLNMLIGKKLSRIFHASILLT